MRFHLVDRIEELRPHESVRAVKATSLAEPYWQGEPPVMPPSLVLESICQAGTWLIMGSTELTRRAALLQVGELRTHGLVRPGQRLELTGTVVSWTEEIAVLSGRERSVRLLDELRVRLGDDPAAWMPEFLARTVGAERARAA